MWDTEQSLLHRIIALKYGIAGEYAQNYTVADVSGCFVSQSRFNVGYNFFLAPENGFHYLHYVLITIEPSYPSAVCIGDHILGCRSLAYYST